LAHSDRNRLSVSVVELVPGAEAAFLRLAREFEALLAQKGYGSAEVVRDEADPLRFYAVRHWLDADAAEKAQADVEVQAIAASLYRIARVTHVVTGAVAPGARRKTIDDRRVRFEPDRRSGSNRRSRRAAPRVERRRGQDRRLGPRRLRAAGTVDLVGAARRAREFADAAFSRFKVGAALETADGSVVTGCNIENATYGLTICAERVAMFKALSEGHRAFTRIAIVADTEAPTPPCGACRQILWEFGGNLEIKLANLTKDTGTHRLQDLLPLPFDARLL
jgi:cytidine deaminase